MGKVTQAAAPAKKSNETLSPRGGTASPQRPSTARFESFAGLQHTLGNQAMVSLLTSPRIQTKSRWASTDLFESEADRAADFVLHRLRAPVLQRKCAGGDSCSCGKCAGKDEEQRLTKTSTRIQRQPKDASRPPAESTAEARTRQPRSLIVDDEAPSIAPGQMRKSAFLAQLRRIICLTVDADLAGTPHSAQGCPYIQKWLAFYENKDSQHLESALLKYAPEAKSARAANDYIPIVAKRVHLATLRWLKTGQLTGIPEELAKQISGGGMFESVGGFFSAVGSSLLGFLAGSSTKEESPHGSVARKARDGAGAAPHDASAVQAQLGSGRALDSGARSRMESAFGRDFSGVRIHTDSRAASLSSELNARAFTIGRNVAFGSGEYNPGTPVGDALLAHELAHVVQQGGGNGGSPAPMTKSADQSNQSSVFEAEADAASTHAVASVWSGAKNRLADLRLNSVPRLRSGLRLQRCPKEAQVKTQVAPARPTPEATQVCAPPDAAAWRTQVHDAKELMKTDIDHAAGVMVGLVEQALCPLGIRVHTAGTANSSAEDPRDYAESQRGNVINFDVRLNTKAKCAGFNRDGGCRPGNVLAVNAGHNFSHGTRGWAVLGPNALNEGTPLTTRQFAQHELFMLARNVTPGIHESRADTEVRTWTHDFITYFHQYVQEFPRGPRPHWDLLIEYYEDPESRRRAETRSTGPVAQETRDAAIASLADYYRNPPVSQDRREEFNRAFRAWMNKEHGRLVDDLDNVLHLRTTAPSHP